MEAAKLGDPDMVQLLIDNKANVNAKNKKGQTALAFLTESVYGKIIKMLINAGAHPYTMATTYPNETSLTISNESEATDGSLKNKMNRFFRSCKRALLSGPRLLKE